MIQDCLLYRFTEKFDYKQGTWNLKQFSEIEQIFKTVEKFGGGFQNGFRRILL